MEFSCGSTDINFAYDTYTLTWYRARQFGTKRSLYSLDPKGHLIDYVFCVIFVALLIASNGIRPSLYFMSFSQCGLS